MTYQERMSLLLGDGTFKRKVADITSYSHRYYKESAFAAYATERAFRLSATIRPRRQDYHDVMLEEELHEYNSINVGRLLTKPWAGTPFRLPRQDVLFSVHSHPVDEQERPESVLRPSTADLASAEELRTDNPEVVCGIAVPTARACGSLLLFRWSDASRPSLYQRYEEDPATAVILQSMRDSGISTAVLEFTIADKAAVYEAAQAEAAIRALYPEQM